MRSQIQKGAEIKWKSHSTLHEIVEMTGLMLPVAYSHLDSEFAPRYVLPISARQYFFVLNFGNIMFENDLGVIFTMSTKLVNSLRQSRSCIQI